MRRTATAAKVRMATHINDIRRRLHNRRMANNQSCFDQNPAKDISHVCVSMFCKICFACVRRHQQAVSRVFPSQQAAGRPTGQILIHNAGWSGFSGRGGVQNLALPQDTAHVGKFSLRGVAFAFRAIKAIYLADGEFQVFSLPDSCLVCVQGREIQRSPPVSRSRFRHRSRHIRMQQNVSQTPIILCYFRETARGGGKEKKKVKQRIVTIFLHFGFL